jgi:hypothetical protein
VPVVSLAGQPGPSLSVNCLPYRPTAIQNARFRTLLTVVGSVTCSVDEGTSLVPIHPCPAAGASIDRRKPSS